MNAAELDALMQRKKAAALLQVAWAMIEGGR